MMRHHRVDTYITTVVMAASSGQNIGL